MAADANKQLTQNEHMQKAHGFLSPGYDESLFGCFDDVFGILFTCCLPCLPMAAVKSNLDERPCTVVDAVCCPNSYQNRQTLRSKYKKNYEPIADCLTMCCCHCCALHQEVRELAKVSGKPREFFKLPS